MANKLIIQTYCAVLTCLALASPVSLANGIVASSTLSASNAITAPNLPKLTVITGELRDSNGKNLSLPREFMQAFSSIEKDLRIKIILRQYPWNRAVMTATYEGDLIFGLSSTPEREKTFTFSEPVFYNYIWLVTRSDKAFNFRTINDLKGKTIGVVRGSQYGGEFDAKKNKLFQTDDDLDSHEIRLKKLLENRIDAMLYASLLDNPLEVEKVVNDMSVFRGDSNESKKIKFSVLAIPVLKNDLRFAIRKEKNNGWIQKINGSINKMNQDKTKQKSVLNQK